ncbi:MAG: N-acetylmuramoyl-L-alanine amidase [Bradyrhizobium sp.]|nr:N-acetylmuramoyl-L-alanine amidase [Bradyrhizobium sp.]
MTEFKQIAAVCKIFNADTAEHEELPELGLPEQLVEVLPLPPLKPNETAQQWDPFYHCKVFADDGIRFTRGIVAKENTKPLNQTVDTESYAVECFNAAKAAGIEPVALLAVADYLSGIESAAPPDSPATGPFRFIQESWPALISGTPDLALNPADRLFPYEQPAVAAAEMAATAEKFATAQARLPNVAEHAFVRLFGRLSIDLLAQRAKQPASPDPSIDTIVASFSAQELGGKVTPEALVADISAAHTDLLGPPGARRTVSAVLQALATALEASVARARTLLAPLQPVLPPPREIPAGIAGNLKLDVNDVYRDEIMAAATKCAMDPAGLAALIDAEADKLANGQWNRNSRNPTSTAVGLTQFLKGSWIDMATRAATTLNQTAKQRGFVDNNNRVTNSGDLLALRTDPALSIMSAAEYAASNLSFVIPRITKFPGLYDPSTPDGKMRLAYLCHHEGTGGALKYLRGGKDPSYVAHLDSYIDRRIVPSRFRTAVTVVGPGPDLSPDRDTTGPSTRTTPGNGTIPNDVMAVPAGRPLDFAALQAPEAQWHWPVITADTQAMKISYRTGPGSVAGKPSREFLANRQGGKRFHVGMDIFCHQGDIVLAIADGTIVRFYHFYEGTNALFVAHDGVVVNYGEVEPNSNSEFGWHEGSRVTAGQRIARVGRLNMIHFETYRPNTTQNERWMQNGSPPPPNLRNPTRVLLGLAAKGRRIIG